MVCSVVQAWARRRARQGGLPQPDRVALVSAAGGTGVAGLLRVLHEEVAGRGDVWVVHPPANPVDDAGCGALRG